MVGFMGFCKFLLRQTWQLLFWYLTFKIHHSGSRFFCHSIFLPPVKLGSGSAGLGLSEQRIKSLKALDLRSQACRIQNKTALTGIPILG